MSTSNPPVIPGREQTLDQLAPRMNDARRELMAAIVAGKVTWMRPSGDHTSHTVWDRGPQKTVDGQRSKRMKTVTGEINWLRSHGLAKLGQDLTREATAKTVVLTDRGRDLLELLGQNA